MTDDTPLPVFPTTAPDVCSDVAAMRDLFAQVLDRLADVVELADDERALASPCDQYDAGQLQAHVLGWLDFFATAMSDPGASSPRHEPDAFVLGGGERADALVLDAAARIDRAIDGGVAGELVVMTGARMAGDAVLGMALGEYLLHGWDLARSTGQPYDAPADAIAPAHEFLLGMIAPQYRGPGSGFFDHEVPVPDGAPPFDRLLGFAGRDPSWRPRPSG